MRATERTGDKPQMIDGEDGKVAMKMKGVEEERAERKC